MMKKTFFATLGLLLICGIGHTLANGPSDLILKTEAAKKPAIFPHALHQASFGCDSCHHGMADGKQVPYVKGEKVSKCTSCHNKTTLGGKTISAEGIKKPLKLDTFRGAGHGKCLVCHIAMAKQDPALKAKKFDKCSTCHPKKKK